LDLLFDQLLSWTLICFSKIDSRIELDMRLTSGIYWHISYQSLTAKGGATWKMSLLHTDTMPSSVALLFRIAKASFELCELTHVSLCL